MRTLREGSWVCGVPFSDAKGPAAPNSVPPESAEMTQEQLLDSFHLMAPSGEDLPILWNAVSNYENIRSREISDIKKWKVRPGAGGPSSLCLPCQGGGWASLWF